MKIVRHLTKILLAEQHTAHVSYSSIYQRTENEQCIVLAVNARF